MTTKENGNALIIAALCSAPNASAPSPPPAKSKMKAIRDCAIPHVTLN